MKRCIILLILLIATFLVLSTSEATVYYFDFVPQKQAANHNGEVKITLMTKSKINKEEWVVKGKADNATITVFDKKRGSWAPSGVSWAGQPSYEENLLLKIKSEKEKIELEIILMNLKTGESYSTPQKPIWTQKAFDRYRERLNMNLQNIRQEVYKERLIKRQKNKDPLEEQTKQIKDLKEGSKPALISLGGFITAAAAGFLRKDDKIAS